MDDLDEVVEEYVEEEEPRANRPKRKRMDEDSDEVVEEYVEEKEPRAKRLNWKQADNDLDEVVEEYVEEEEPRQKRSKKKRMRKYRHPVASAEEESETPAWLWWAGGGAGIALTFVILIVIALVAPAESKLKSTAVILIVSLPISTVIFFVALILASMIVGAVEIGEIHVAIFKSFALILPVSLVSLIPFVGPYLTPLVWIPGLMLLFRLDFWETCMVMFFNWLPNYLLRLALMAIVISGAMHGGSGIERDQPPTKSRPADDGHVWDEDDVMDLGGWIEYDRSNPAAPIIVGIVFRDAAIGDAELVHMKDFPHLMRLTLANTQVTDAGLKHLAACKQLISLDVSDTAVTAAGLNELRKALPNLRIFP